MRPSGFRLVRKFRSIGGDFLDLILSLEALFVIKENMNGQISKASDPEIVPCRDSNSIIIFAVYCKNLTDLEGLELNFDEALISADVLYVINTGPYLIPQSSRYIAINRKNIGRDLRSYAVGIKMLEKFPTDQLVLLNDSVHWFPGSITNFIDSSWKSSYEIASITASKQGGYHLQSYALAVKKPTLDLVSPICDMKLFRLKRNLIRHGELKFSRFWRAKNVPIGPVWSIASEVDLSEEIFVGSKRDFVKLVELTKQKVPLNPSIHYWPWLLHDMKIIKKSLLRSNPAKFDIYPQSISDVTK